MSHFDLFAIVVIGLLMLIAGIVWDMNAAIRDVLKVLQERR